MALKRDFVEVITESYVVDRNIANPPVDPYTELRSIFEELRLLNDSLYDMIAEGSAPFQQKIIYTILDSIYEINTTIPEYEYIQEDLGIGTAIAAATLAAATLQHLLKPTSGTHTVGNILMTLTNISKQVHKLIEKLFGYKKFKVLNSILYNRLEKCSKQCGVHEFSDLGSFAPGTLLKDYSVFSGDKYTTIKVECLKNCYLQFHVDTIAILAAEYKLCLQRTGSNYSIKDITALHIRPTDAQCIPFYDTLQNYIGNFNETMKILFNSSEDIDERAKWTRLLNDKLAKADKNPKNTKQVLQPVYRTNNRR